MHTRMASLVAGKHTFTTKFYIHLLFLLSKNPFTPSPLDSIKYSMSPLLRLLAMIVFMKLKERKEKESERETGEAGPKYRHATLTELKASVV